MEKNTARKVAEFVASLNADQIHDILTAAASMLKDVDRSVLAEGISYGMTMSQSRPRPVPVSVTVGDDEDDEPAKPH